MSELESKLKWYFSKECEIPSNVSELLTENEIAENAYQTLRDIAIFTNKRLIVCDKQGLTGKKVEIYSLPYSSINMWSSENGGMLDLTAEIELWTRAGNIKIQLAKGIDVRKLDKLIGDYVLNK